MSWELTHQSQGGFTLLEMILGPEAAQKGVTNREGAAVRPFVSLSSFGLPTRWLNRCPTMALAVHQGASKRLRRGSANHADPPTTALRKRRRTRSPRSFCLPN